MKTLEERFEAIDNYHPNWKEGCAEIAQQFAIEFSEWLIKKCDFQKHGVWLYKGIEMTQEELILIFENQS